MNRQALICLVFIFVATHSYSQNWLATMEFTPSEYKAQDYFSLDGKDVVTEFQSLKIHPIPVKDYLELSGDFKPTNLRLYDLQGQLIYRSHSMYEKINLAFLQNGKYVLMAIDKESRIKTIQFVKE